MTRQSRFDAELASLLPRLRRFGLTLTGSDDASDELVQVTCERALSRAHQWKPGSHFDRWAFSIMHSVWKNELRAQSIRRGAGFVDVETLSFDDAPRLMAQAELARMVRAVMSLPEAQRGALLLVYVEGYTYQEAADILGTPVGTVMSRLARGRVQIAKIMRLDRGSPDPLVAIQTREP